MATQMMIQRSSTRKRDAETAFTVDNQHTTSRAREEDVEPEISTQVKQHAQQLLVNDLFKASRKSIRKYVNRLGDEIHDTFAAVENQTGLLRDAHKAEMDNSLAQMEQYLLESKAARTESFSLSLGQIEQQLALLDHLGDCYIDKNHGLSAELDVDAHVRRREQHKTKISHRGAQVAQMQMKKAAEEIQFRIDKKQFLEAHRDFFKAIQTSSAQV